MTMNDKGSILSLKDYAPVIKQPKAALPFNVIQGAARMPLNATKLALKKLKTENF